MTPATAPVVVVLDDQGPTQPALTAIAPPPSAAPTPPSPPPEPPTPIAEVITTLQHLKDLSRRALFEKILRGESFADSERDNALQRAASTVAWVAPFNPTTEGPDALVPLFRASLAVWAGEATARLTLEEELDKLAEKISRAQTEAREERARLAAEDKAILERLSPTQATPAFVTGSYDADELAALAAAANCTEDELEKRWIVQKDDIVYLLTMEGSGKPRYTTPIRRAGLKKAMSQFLARAPLEWTRPGHKGLVNKSVDDMIEDYGVAAEHISSSLVLQHSYFDPLTHTFHEAVCPLRPITPRQHPEVDAWLRALGGADAERLLDWVATITFLDKSTCALYLSGPKGTGKTLLATALARLWSEGEPTDIDRVLDNFNADLARCPLILADEALPPDPRGKQTSATLRKLLGNTVRTLTRKFAPNAELHGCVRLIMAANNENLLAFNESMDPDDIQAIAERVLHIDTTAAAKWLESRGRSYVEGWVSQDIVAEHALWLRDTRTVNVGVRWLVDGHTSKVHQSIATRGPVPSMVAEWLVRHLDRPSPAIRANAPIRVGGGQFLVNTTILTEYWGQYLSSERVPNTHRLGRALKGLGTGAEVRIDGVRCHEINVDALCRWSEENQISEPDVIRARVNAPVLLSEEGQGKVEVKGPQLPATIHDIRAAVERAIKQEESK